MFCSLCFGKTITISQKFLTSRTNFTLIQRHFKTGFVLKNDTANAAALAGAKSNVRLVPLKSISEEDLGVSILHLKENGSGETNHDYHRKIIKRAKV